MWDYRTAGSEPGMKSTATVHEAAGRLGALGSAIQPAFDGAQVFGPALPVLCPAGDNLWLHHAIYAAECGEVLVVAIDEPHDVEYGYWGEVMAVAAQARGVGGLVIDGGVRDTTELRDVGFPVFSSAVCIRGTIKDPTATGSIGEPVRLGEVTVQHGDLVIGDADGVVVIPRSRVDEVITASADRVEKEAQIMAQLRAGKTTIDLFDLPRHNPTTEHYS